MVPTLVLSSRPNRAVQQIPAITLGANLILTFNVRKAKETRRKEKRLLSLKQSVTLITGVVRMKILRQHRTAPDHGPRVKIISLVPVCLSISFVAAVISVDRS